MYKKKLVKVSKSYYALIPAVVLKMLNINPDKDEILMSIENNKIIIEKTSNE